MLHLFFCTVFGEKMGCELEENMHTAAKKGLGYPFFLHCMQTNGCQLKKKLYTVEKKVDATSISLHCRQNNDVNYRKSVYSAEKMNFASIFIALYAERWISTIEGLH